MSKSLNLVLIIGGAVLIIGGILLMMVIVPGMRMLPDDFDGSRYYDVDYMTMLNPEAMEFLHFPPEASGDLSMERNLVVEDTDDSLGLVRETQTVFLGEAPLVPPVIKRHTVERSTLEHLTDPPAAWTELDGYVPRTGLTFGWGPNGVEERDYVGWSEDFRTEVDFVFIEEQERGGITTYYFKGEMPPTPIDQAHVATMGLPPSFSIDTMSQLVAAFEIEDPEIREQLQTALPQLVEAAVIETQGLEEGAEIIVPLVYFHDYVTHYWVEPTTGILIDIQSYENRTVGFPQDIMVHMAAGFVEAGINPAALFEFYPITITEFEFRTNQQSVADAVADAEDLKDMLALFGTTIPIALIAVGVLALLGGLYRVRTSGKPQTEG